MADSPCGAVQAYVSLLELCGSLLLLSLGHLTYLPDNLVETLVR